MYLVRHAEAAGGEDPNGGLSARGRQQATLLGERLREVPFESIQHSPLTRAEQTARLIAEQRAASAGGPTEPGGRAPQVPVRSSEFLRDLTPVPVPGAESEYPARYHQWLAETAEHERDEGGARISAAIEHFTRTESGPDQNRHHLLVTHGFVIGWFVARALEAPTWRWLGLNSANTGLTIIRSPAQGPATLISFNDTGHLPFVLSQ